MMRVAFDVHTIGQRATGNETYAENLLEALIAEADPGVELHFYHSKAIDHARWTARFRRLRPHWPYVRIPLVTPYWLAHDRIDVAHFQYVGPPLSPCATVLTVHDLSFERHPEFFPRAMAARMRLLMRMFAPRAQQIIAVSEATRRELLSCYEAVDPERVSVVHNGTSPYFEPVRDRDSLAADLARLRLERPFIACVGNLGARKNQLLLVRAFGRLVREESIAHDLVLVGKQTHGSAAILAEIAAQGLGQRVHVTGFVSAAELRALYNLAAFTVYPSLYEGFGLPIVESMACATPVITSTVSCMPEIAGDAALLVAPDDVDALRDAMKLLLASESTRARLAAAGLTQSRRFSWAQAARQTLDVYRKAALHAS